MEILKFDESGSSSPSRKRSGRGAILVAFVAVVFGASTALASGTLTINNNEGIELAQGVQQTTQCDTDVTISLDSALSDDASKFYLHGITVSEIADACLGKYLRLKVYSSDGTQQVFCSAPPDSGCAPEGNFVNGVVSPFAPDANVIQFTFSNILELFDANTAKNVTIETINIS